MKVHELFESVVPLTQEAVDRLAESVRPKPVHIVTKYGELVAHNNYEVEEEEYPGYLPKGVDHDKVVELSTVEVKPKFVGQGHGKELMKKFLASNLAKNADLIFLDLNDGMRPEGSELEHWSEKKYLNFLRSFYKQFGFVDGNKWKDRMWKIVNAKVKKADLP